MTEGVGPLAQPFSEDLHTVSRSRGEKKPRHLKRHERTVKTIENLLGKTLKTHENPCETTRIMMKVGMKSSNFELPRGRLRALALKQHREI